MKAIVINLAGETARMAYMAKQLDGLDLPWERLEATTPHTLSPPADDPYWQGWERALRTTEMAAMASHRAAWCMVVARDEPMLILEDDAVLHADVPEFLAAVAPLPDAELISLETRGRRKLIARHPHPNAPMHRLWQDRTGAAAYILKPSGAQKLLTRVARAPGLADAILCAAYDVQAWQAVPALAVQLDQCEDLGFTPPIATDSAIGREAKPLEKPKASQRLRRIRGQLRIGVRQITRAPGAEKLIVPYGTRE